MKKMMLLLAAAVTSLAAMATTYSGVVRVSVNGLGASQEAAIDVDQNKDGTFTLSLKNFVLQAEDNVIGVGNIELPNVSATTTGGFNELAVDQSVTISAGDLEGIDLWMGPLLGAVPIVMSAQFNDSALGATIDIDMSSSLGQVIEVQFTGVAPAAPNADLNGDGVIDAADVTKIISILLGN